MIIAQVGPLVPDQWWSLLTVGGPVAGILGVVLWKVNQERERLAKENRELREQYENELREIRERLFAGLNNATIAITTGATTVEAVKTALNTIVDALIRRERSRDDAHH